ncbi:MAG: DEAD/DEAH box helicase [Terriglobia bacterium]
MPWSTGWPNGHRLASHHLIASAGGQVYVADWAGVDNEESDRFVRETAIVDRQRGNAPLNVTQASGPGVADWLIERLQSWGISTLTDVQVKALVGGIADGRSMIVSAPTSSGKTLVGEIAALSALREGVRTIYLVSHKALADQKYLDFLTRFGEGVNSPIASVGLNTGDREEGDIDAQMMVATYEKALGLVLAGQLNASSALVVADELQILGDPGRGPDIEALCSVLRQRGIRQFVALTATVENPGDLAGWMGCRLVQSTKRDVPLHQEIWYSNRVYRTTFGQDEGYEIVGDWGRCEDVEDVIGHLLRLQRGPVLVFVESRREAANFAAAFGRSRPRVGVGIALAEQLDLFSEPTESSDQLRDNAERCVAFHSADLSPQERQILEAGFSKSQFDVCFATSTLAAGVNFPFRSIVFPKLTFEWGDRQGTHIPRSDYRNMSGRAGRLGMHTEGYSILLPRNNVELNHANELVRSENDRLKSQMVNLSLRKSILTLVASRLVNSRAEVMIFFQNTLYWYQTLDRNPKKLASLGTESEKAIEWLIVNELLVETDGTLLVTPLGKATALSGLLPGTTVHLARMLTKLSPTLAASFEEWIPGLIYAVCASEEFHGERPSRFLPYPSGNLSDSVTFWYGKELPVPFDRTDLRLAKCAHAIALFVDGVADRKIAHATQVSSGQVHRLATDVSWVLDGLHKLAAVPDLKCPQPVGNQIAMLARRVRWGAPAEALDIMRIAERHKVPGFGRQRAMALIAQGIVRLQDILATAKDRLTQLLRSEHRAQALLDAASNSFGYGPSRFAATHQRVAKELGIAQLVDECNQALGVEYEKAIMKLLRVETDWDVTALDDGERQNVPDLHLQLGNTSVLIECKTCSKSPPLIKKEEAWAILQKASDFDQGMRRVTLGKPQFDETSKKKAAASQGITLVEHTVFVEGLLRLHAGTLSANAFLDWISTPGVAEIERLGGIPTYSPSQR